MQAEILLVVDYLLQKGSDPNVKAGPGLTALLMAVSEDKLEIVECWNLGHIAFVSS